MENFETQPAKKSRTRLWAMLAALPLLVIIGAVVLWTTNTDSPDSESHRTATKSSVSEPVKVTLTDQGISPSTITIKKGQTVTWTNTDSRAWQLTADATSLPQFDTVQALTGGDSFSYTFEKSGTYSYYDASEPNDYNATVIVQ